MHISHYLPRPVPEPLSGLATLAFDLRWTWHHSTDNLWAVADADLWEATRNPLLVLESLSDERLERLAGDTAFLKMLQQHLEAREEHFGSASWFSRRPGEFFPGYVAYFSMEFGLSESLPIYSGGLGVLAGDHLKTACDLGVPLVGIGLLYQQGYFRQALDSQGEQLDFYPYNSPTMLPVSPLMDDKGDWISVTVEFPNRPLRLRAWHAQVGRRSLFLLDSNDPLNYPGDRGITAELYGGGQEMRLQQEIVLGIGGWRLLQRLGLDCPVCHLNEGHAAFAILERARSFMERYQQPFEVALRTTRAGNLFTSHTPVEAGFDRFPPALFLRYFKEYAAGLGISAAQLLALGRGGVPGKESEPFNMASLACHGAGAVNGVSELHAEVSRGIFQPLFPRYPKAEVPVGHVTNGVHMPTWDSAVADALWSEACGQAPWRGELESVENNLRSVDDRALWNFRSKGRAKLLEYLQNRMSGLRSLQNAPVGRPTALDPGFLTLGFARRFTEYKRNNLLLTDPQRLTRLLTSRDRPVQLVIAGKAHPRDEAGKHMIRQWADYIRRNDLKGRVVFVEDYDLVVAAEMVQGVDVWINTPRRPWEASGTSGMKVLVNGGLNLSALDGWWAEAYGPEVGWAIGDKLEHPNVVEQDARDAEQLYRVLEGEVVPAFYRRDDSGLPRDWLALVRESMATLTGRFSTNRMMREYTEKYYAPLAAAYAARAADGCALARGIERWHAEIRTQWHRMYFGNVTAETGAEGHQFRVQVYLDGMPPEAIAVELYAEASGDLGQVRQPLEQVARLEGMNSGYLYAGTVPSTRPTAHYTARIVPAHRAASIPLEAPLITWYK